VGVPGKSRFRLHRHIRSIYIALNSVRSPHFVSYQVSGLVAEPPDVTLSPRNSDYAHGEMTPLFIGIRRAFISGSNILLYMDPVDHFIE
jgi:hypothetical protein